MTQDDDLAERWVKAQHEAAVQFELASQAKSLAGKALRAGDYDRYALHKAEERSRRELSRKAQARANALCRLQNKEPK